MTNKLSSDFKRLALITIKSTALILLTSITAITIIYHIDEKDSCSSDISESDVQESSSNHTFQSEHSMDWDSDDSYMMMKLATYYGGSVEDNAYTMLVTLNRVWDGELHMSISELVEYVLYQEGLSYDEVCSIQPDDKSKEALNMIMHDNFDNSNGSLTYLLFD